MKKIVLSTLVATTLLVANNKYEITPMIGHVDTKEHKVFENHDIFGLTIGLNRDKDCKFDQTEIGFFQANNVDYKNGTRDTQITRLFIDQLKEYEIVSNLKLFALVGLGYEKNYSYLIENDPYFNYGAGVKYALNDKFTLRVDARHLLRFDGMKHVMYTAGLSIGFGESASKKLPITDEPKQIQDEPKQIQDEPKQIQKDIKEVTQETKVVKKVVLDSDNDGVINTKDRCPNSAPNANVDTNGCKIEVKKVISKEVAKKMAKPVDLEIVFASNSDKIKSLDSKKFEPYAEYLKIDKDAKVIIEAHTDSTGSAAYNLKLSQKRAKSAKAQLVSMGIEASRIKDIGYGETKPKVSNDTAKNREINRRVTVRIVK
jgi:OOP family OmpA-OmpF porin